MTKYLIDDDTAYKDFKDYLQEKPKILSVEGNVITTEDFSVEVLEQYSDLVETVKLQTGIESLKEVIYQPDYFDTIENSGYKFRTY